MIVGRMQSVGAVDVDGNVSAQSVFETFWRGVRPMSTAAWQQGDRAAKLQCVGDARIGPIPTGMNPKDGSSRFYVASGPFQCRFDKLNFGRGPRGHCLRRGKNRVETLRASSIKKTNLLDISLEHGK